MSSSRTVFITSDDSMMCLHWSMVLCSLYHCVHGLFGRDWQGWLCELCERMLSARKAFKCLIALV